jgi:glyoxylase-like metal-dependent hydrolase (beta-lactamase superfamily II)
MTASAAEPARGVARIVLPIPFELDHVNVYLVRDADGWLLIDSGIESNACFDALAAGLASHGIAITAIRTIVLTHMHPDHIGLASRLIGMSGARLLMHRAELQHLRALIAGTGDTAEEGLRFGGVPAVLRKKIKLAVGLIRDSLRSLHPDWILEGGERIETGHEQYEVVWTPGHSPGHICLYGKQSRLLFSGDHILTDITPNISWQPGRDMLAEFLASLRKLEPYDIDLILPAHGEPFDGHREWIADTICHHDDRSNKILLLLGAGRKTAHELIAGIWPERFGPFHHYFAVFEVLAHLEHMKRKGLVESHDTPEGAVMWGVR